MAIINFDIHVEGIRPLLMHSDQGVNPRHPLTIAKKALTAKRTKKTEDDQLEIDKLDYLMSFYIDKDLGPYIPGNNLHKSLVEAARITRDGKTIERGVQIMTDKAPLQYVGPRDPEVMWKDDDFVSAATVKVQSARIMRYRPKFETWSFDVEGLFDNEIIDATSLQSHLRKSGAMIGLGDWRPRYGLFEAVLEVKGEASL